MVSGGHQERLQTELVSSCVAGIEKNDLVGPTLTPSEVESLFNARLKDLLLS
jgi:hypothetical protein